MVVFLGDIRKPVTLGQDTIFGIFREKGVCCVRIFEFTGSVLLPVVDDVRGCAKVGGSNLFNLVLAKRCADRVCACLAIAVFDTVRSITLNNGFEPIPALSRRSWASSPRMAVRKYPDGRRGSSSAAAAASALARSATSRPCFSAARRSVRSLSNSHSVPSRCCAGRPNQP